MKKLCLVSLFFFGLILTPSAHGQGRDEVFGPMKFVDFCPCAGMASFCYNGLLAIGYIESDSAKKLEAAHPLPGTNVYMHSPGGSLAGGLALGATIRKLRLNTIVGGDYDEAISLEESRTLVKNSFCASSTAFAFLGGIRREVRDPKSFLVHQFYTEARVGREGDIQRTVAILNSYLDEMGIPRQLLDGALLTKPENLTYFTIKQLWDLKVYNSPIFLALPEEIEAESTEADNKWKLFFDANEQPLATLKRSTPHKNGEVTCSVKKNAHVLEITLAVQWTETEDAARLNESYRYLTSFGPQTMDVYFCWATAPSTTDYRRCPKSAFSMKVPVHKWSKASPRSWRLHFQLSAMETERFLETRPDFFYVDCKMPNAVGKFRFCDSFHLTRDFWRLTSLMR